MMKGILKRLVIAPFSILLTIVAAAIMIACIPWWIIRGDKIGATIGTKSTEKQDA